MLDEGEIKMPVQQNKKQSTVEIKYERIYFWGKADRIQAKGRSRRRRNEKAGGFLLRWDRGRSRKNKKWAEQKKFLFKFAKMKDKEERRVEGKG